ncbi:MAG TPA: putrescine ABC transporter permease PotI, partial [Xanthobacteraceae bacterium]|nr:putrescine ABC transporter permease PotI [Xanthobacteraceae bacterium]
LGVTPEINAACSILIGVVTVAVIIASIATKRAEKLRASEERAAARG